MSKLRILNFQLGISRRLPRKPVKWLSIRDRQVSDLMRSFKPNVEEMKQVFDKISEGSGKISENNLKSLLEKLGKRDAACKAKRMIEAADLDRDGFLDFKEFMEVHKNGIKTCDIKSAFRMFDQDGDERISADELQSMLEKLGEYHSLDQCRRMINHADQNGDGFVDMNEFLAMMTRTMEPT
ncbi:calmodulin-like protein 30 [Phoenix dactylifera]|uniref:Calmodulin-like protein 30 n=1 Tax=Phoenix dactylifera TaxID=42345 RepID=A0A8B7CT15_PHODC|nr:calmodulin-like protein 30 [Phoenix dactylifera]